MLQLASSLFPGVMLELCSAAGFGAVIGAIAPIVTFAVFYAIGCTGEKVSEHSTSPKVESATPSSGIKKEAAAFQ